MKMLAEYAVQAD